MAKQFSISPGQVNSVINNFKLNIPDISLKDLSGDKVTEALNNIMSAATDDFAKQLLKGAGLEPFQRIGEGFLQTAVRVGNGIELADSKLMKFGVAIVKYGDVVNKQGDVGLEIYKQTALSMETRSDGIISGVGKIIKNFDGSVSDLDTIYIKLRGIRSTLNASGINGNNLSAYTIQGAGGLDDLNKSVNLIATEGVSKTKQFNDQFAELGQQFTSYGQVMPTSIQQYRSMVASIDTSTDAGQRLQGQLLSLAPNVYELNDLFKGSQAEIQALMQIGYSADDSSRMLTNLTDSFSDLGEGMRYVNNIVNAFFNDIQKRDFQKDYYKGQQQAAIDASPYLQSLGVASGMSVADVQKIMDNKGITWIDIGKYNLNVNAAADPISQFLNATGYYAAADKSTAQDNYTAQASANKSSNTTNDATKKAEENAKTVLDLNKDISKQLAGIKASDIEKSILDINTAIDDMIAKASEAGGQLPEAEVLRSARLNKVAEDWAKETNQAFARIGNSDLQNQLLDISDKFIKLDADAKILANAGLVDLAERLSKNAALKSDEISKLAQSLFDDPVKQFQRIGNTDLQNSLADIGDQFATLRTQAQQLAAASPALVEFLPGVLAGIDALEKAQKQKLFKDLVDEFNAIGKSNVQKSLDGVYQWMQDTLKIAPELAATYGKSVDVVNSGIKAVALERAKVAVGWGEIIDEYNNIGKTDAEKQVASFNKTYNESVNSLFDTFNHGLISSDELMFGLNISLAVFQNRLKSLTDQVDESNNQLLTKAGMGPNQAALADIIAKFNEQKATVTTVATTKATSPVVTTSLNNSAEMLQFNQVKSNFASWVKSWDPNGVNAQFIEFTKRINQLTSNSDVDALANWVGQQAGTGVATAQWIRENSSMLFHFEAVLRDALQNLSYVSQPAQTSGVSTQTSGVSTQTVSYSNDLNSAALRQSIFDWFRMVNTDFDTIGQSDYRKALESINAEVKDWLAGINDAVGSLGNTAEYQAMAQGARNQVQAVAQAKRVAIEQQYRQPLLDQIYTLSHTKEQALIYTRNQEIAAMDESLQPLQRTINALQDMRDAATKTQDAIASATTSITDMIDKLTHKISAQDDYAAAKNLLSSALANAQAGIFDNIDKTVGNLGALTGDESKKFVTAADYKRDQQGVINTLNQLKDLASNYNISLDTLTVPAFATGGLHDGGYRLVGEKGPELEYTGPSRIYNSGDTQKLFDMSELVGHIKKLTDEVSRLRDENKQLQIQVVKHVKKTADLAEKSDIIGAPPVRS